MLGATMFLLGIGEAECIHNPEAVTLRLDTEEEDHLRNRDHRCHPLDHHLTVMVAAAAVAVDTADTDLVVAAAVAVAVDMVLEAEAAVVDHHHTQWLTILHFDHPSHLPNRTSRPMTSSKTSPPSTNGTKMPSL
jgi:uncharacterized protein (DUF1778 family)